MERFFERNHDIGFHVVSARRTAWSPTESAATKSRLATASAEKRLEEIAETGTAKFEFHYAAILTTITIESAARLRSTPFWRWLKSAGLIPIRAELIVFLALLPIAQDFVSLVDLFKLFFGCRFVLGDIRMIFPRQLSKGAADFVIGRCFRNTQRFVIISELNRPKILLRNLLHIVSVPQLDRNQKRVTLKSQDKLIRTRNE
jgi:hypothetical protein